MSERDCPDEMAVLWAEKGERIARNKLLAHSDCRDPAHPGCSECRPRFEQTYCSQCGNEFGPGDEGFSHCADHSHNCDCRSGECESKHGRICRMTVEIANGNQ